MTLISDLPWDLVEEILSRVSLTSLRAVGSTCKRWNALSKDERFTKKHCDKSGKEFVVTMSCENITSTWRFNLHNIKDLSKEIGGMLCPVEISKVVYQCDGLLLLVTKDSSRLVVWNPYLMQTRWIEPRNNYYYMSYLYAIGYDNKNNHKVLRIFDDDFDQNIRHEIYDFKSNSWRVLGIISNFCIWPKRGVSLKGNTYFVAHYEREHRVICFDFTIERFGPHLHLPFDFLGNNAILSCVREEQLALFSSNCSTATCEMKIWITTKIEPNALSWSKFFKVDIQRVPRRYFIFYFEVRSFFIDMEKKIAVLCGKDYCNYSYETSIVVGEDGYFEEIMDITDVFSYVPSSVQLQ